MYFSGHGYIDGAGGLPMCERLRFRARRPFAHEVLAFANSSPAKNKVIILDSCHSGAPAPTRSRAVAEIKEGVTILTASTAEQYAMETGGRGVFTGLFVDALNGAAANLVGDVTPGSVYAHIDQSLGPWAQRPVFKTNIKKFVSLREADAPIELVKLQQLTVLFNQPTMEIQLDPSYEPERTERGRLGTRRRTRPRTPTSRCCRSWSR